MYWWKRTPCVVFLCGNHGVKKAFKETKICGVIGSKRILFLYRFFFAELKNDYSILSFVSFSYYESKKKFFCFWKHFGIYTTNLPLKCINCVGMVVNNPPVIQLSYKFEFILCKNWGSSYKNIKTLDFQSSTQ